MSTALYLVSHDLRLDDNRALVEAASYETLLVVYCVDPRWFRANSYSVPSMGPHRWRFIKESLADLASKLREYGQHLHVVYGPTVAMLRRIITEIAPQALITNRPHGWYEHSDLLEIQRRFPQLTMKLVDNTTLFDHDEAAWLSAELPRQFTPFRKLAESQRMRDPIPALASLPAIASAKPKADPWGKLDASFLPRWAVSTVKPETPFIGGEKTAQHHLQRYFSHNYPSTYKATRNSLDGWYNSSKWSSWLSQGCLSPRRLHYAIRQYEIQYGANESTYWLKFELLWREYFHWLALKLGTKLFSFKGMAKQKPLTSFYPERFKRWCEGNTPYPLVNACMRELDETGYMSNRGRQIVASCLVNELQVDWRYGAAWFEHQLIDYDVGSNWGNWQYIAGVGVDPRGGRRFDLEKQQRQFDPNLSFVHRWLGEQFKVNTASTVDSVDAADWPIT